MINCKIGKKPESLEKDTVYLNMSNGVFSLKKEYKEMLYFAFGGAKYYTIDSIIEDYTQNLHELFLREKQILEKIKEKNKLYLVVDSQYIEGLTPHLNIFLNELEHELGDTINR